MSDGGSFLSEQGRRRREEIARLACAAARDRQRRRIRSRAAGTAAAGCIVLAIVAIIEWPRGTPDVQPLVVQKPIAMRPPAVVVTRIETEPNISTRLAIPREAPKWRIVGDDDLLQTLAEAGHPAGLVRMNGQAILLLR